ncbi:MAG: DUF6630 family protein [Saprospiraceae bacterium]
MNQEIVHIIDSICFNNSELASSILSEINLSETDSSVYLTDDGVYKFGRFIGIDDLDEVKFFLGIDRLLDEGLLCELDWKSDLADVEYCINLMFKLNNIEDVSVEIPEDWDEELSERSFVWVKK